MLSNKFDLTDSFRAKGKLVKVQTKIWGGKKLSPELSSHVATAVSGSDKSFKVNKCLIDEDRIKTMRGIDRKRRNAFNPYVCMWDREWQLLPNKNEEIITSAWNDFSKEFNDEKDKLVADYPELKEQAKIDLGDSYNDDDYPTIERLKGGKVQVRIGGTDSEPEYKEKEVKGLFHADIFFDQVPELHMVEDNAYYQDSGIGGLIGNVAYNSHEYYEDKIIELNQRNKQDLISSLGGFANAISGYDKSNKKGKFFKNSIVDNLEKSLNGLKGKNDFFEDEYYDEIIEQAKEIVKGKTAQELREDDSLRESVAEEIKGLETKATDIFG